MSKINKSRLFTASCVALTVTAMTFAIRAGLLTDLGEEFNLNDTKLGWMNFMAFLGFPVATMIGGPLYNIMGPKKLMWVAFITHILGLFLTIYAGGFWTLIISTFFIGFANGSVEAACNPMIADMYKKNQTTMLNKFHVWFPGGIVIGSLIVFLLGDKMNIIWQAQVAIMIIPTLIYAYLIFGEKFPEVTKDKELSFIKLFSPIYLLIMILFVSAAASDVTLKYLVSAEYLPIIKIIFLAAATVLVFYKFGWLYAFLAVCMSLTATAELGTQQWVERILGNAGANPMIILALVTGIMALGRYFGGPLIHKLKPIGVLFASAIITTIALVLMSQSTGAMVYVSAILFAVGVCYFWPTMIGSTAEYTPETGAIGLSFMGGIGMLAVSLWQPVIGGWLDSERERVMSNGVSLETAELVAGQATLDNLATFPAVLIVLFGVLYFVFGKKLESIRNQDH